VNPRIGENFGTKKPCARGFSDFMEEKVGEAAVLANFHGKISVNPREKQNFRVKFQHVVP
jgi:hypothetical protein